MRKLKKGLAAFLAACMIASVTPVSALAEEAIPLAEGETSVVAEVEQPAEAETPAVTEQPAETPAVTEQPAGEPEETEAPAEEPAATEQPAEEPEETEAPAETETPAGEPAAEQDPEEESGEDGILMDASAGAAYSLAKAGTDSEEDEGSSNEEITPLDDERTYKKMVLIDCGRGFYTVEQIETIIDQMSLCDYGYLVLGFGNDGLRFLLDDMSVTVGETTYSDERIKEAIRSKNDDLAPNAKGQWTEADMDSIISHAQDKNIQIVPMLNTPGHATSLTEAMTACGIQDAALEKRNGSTDTNSVTFDITNQTARNFAEELVKKYIDYFARKNCKLFNLGMDEFAGNRGGWNSMTDGERNTLSDYLQNLSEYLANKRMTPIAFCDVIGNMNNVPDTVIGINWNGQSLNNHSNINANSNWYYVLGETGDGWAGYDRAVGSTQSIPVTSGTADAGCMLAIWNDNYLAANNYIGNINQLVYSLAANNQPCFTPKVSERTIKIQVGKKFTEPLEGKDASITDPPNTDIATADVSQVGKRLKEVTSITSGNQYLIVNKRAGTLLTSRSKTLYNNFVRYNGLALSGTASVGSTDLWTITTSRTGYTIQNVADQNVADRYLEVGKNTASLSNKSTTLSLNYNNGSWTINYDDYYLNDIGKNGCAAGWRSRTASTDDGSQWTIYQIVPATVVTFTGISIGTTFVTVGDTRYTVNVVPEKLDEVSLTYYPFISDFPVYETGASNMGEEGESNPQTLTADSEGVNTPEGTAFSNIAWEYGDWKWEGEKDSVETVYWKGMLHTEEDDKQVGVRADKSLQGKAFAYIRYWEHKWSVSSDRESWTDVEDGNEICAYYLQKTQVTQEVTTYVKDWAYTTADYDRYNSGDRSYKALSFAVVYPDGQLNPTENDIFSKSTLIYWYDTGAKDNDTMMIRVGVNETYEVQKITWTKGTISQSAANDGSLTWETKNIDDTTTWYNENLYWDDTRGTEPVIKTSDFKDQYPYCNQDYNINHKNDALLILIYLKPVETKDSLKVQYWDDSGSREIYSYPINIKNVSTEDPGTFLNRLKQQSGVQQGTITLDKDAYVTNAAGTNETFEQDLTKIPKLFGKYASGLYQYNRAEISEDGKTLILHYVLNEAKLNKSYVIDFGLPVEIPVSDLVSSATVSSVTAQNGSYGTSSVTDNQVVVYTPNEVVKGRDTIRVDVTYNTGETQIFTVAICPATTVYYEEGFATLNNSFSTPDSTGTVTQTLEAAGKKTNNYGYDPAYATNNMSINAPSSEKGGVVTFTFAGDGVDIYTKSTIDSGTYMISITDTNNNLIKLVTVNTMMKNGEGSLTHGQNVIALNVPIATIKMSSRGTYNVKMSQVKSGSAGVKTVFFDGFRVYNTLGKLNDDAYDDTEKNPQYFEMRDSLLGAYQVSTGTSHYADQIGEDIISQVYTKNETTKGAILLGTAEYQEAEITDLLDNGPKNEVYLQPRQSLTFTLSCDAQIGLKSLTGDEVSIEDVNGNLTSLSSATDMFYNIKAGEHTITNTSKNGGILAITKIKVAKENLSGAQNPFAEQTAQTLTPALTRMGFAAAPADPVTAAAALTVNVVDEQGAVLASNELTAEGTVGESHTFPATDIAAAVPAVDGYTVDISAAADVTVPFGETQTVTFTAVQDKPEPTPEPTPEPEPQPNPGQSIISGIINTIKNTIKNIFNGIFGRRW